MKGLKMKKVNKHHDLCAEINYKWPEFKLV